MLSQKRNDGKDAKLRALAISKRLSFFGGSVFLNSAQKNSWLQTLK